MHAYALQIKGLQSLIDLTPSGATLRKGDELAAERISSNAQSLGPQAKRHVNLESFALPRTHYSCEVLAPYMRWRLTGEAEMSGTTPSGTR